MSIFTLIYRNILRLILFKYHVLVSAASFLPLAKKPANDSSAPKKIVATATFYSDQWILTHLKPLAQSASCGELIMVATTPVPDMPKVTPVYPPSWLQKIAGSVGSRMLYFIFISIKERPDVVVGFHLLLNGLLTLFLAKLLNAKSVYICGGGPTEVKGGGYKTENRIFEKLGSADLVIEKQLLKAVNKIDLVVVMGSGAVDYFRDEGITSQIEIIPGGFDDSLFKPADSEQQYDLVLVGRLSDVKRVDRLLEAIKLSATKGLILTAVVVGDGPLREELDQQTEKLGLTDQVYFAGWQNNIEYWLQQSRVFILTSDSEGLSQALIQAMMCGLPSIVSDVGDLKDLVQHDHNGYLVEPLTVEAFSNTFEKVFGDEEAISKRQLMGKNALEDVNKLTVDQVALQWDTILK